MMAITSVDRIRLQAMLGMLGSPHAGERDNAARMVEQFRLQHGFAWEDILASRPGLRPTEPGDGGTGPGVGAAGTGPYQTPPVVIAAPLPRHRFADTIWRWSMLVCIGVSVMMSFTVLAHQHATEAAFSSRANQADICATGGSPAIAAGCASMEFGGYEAGRMPAMPSAIFKPQSPFDQGAADRLVFEQWRKLAPPGLCKQRFSPEQEQMKSACAKAQTLLAGFEQRRRSDPAYRRGWDSRNS